MIGSGHSVRCKLPIAVLLLCFLVTCSGTTSWEDIDVLKTTSGVIQAGNAVRLEPSEFAVAELESASFSVSKFKFDALRTNSTDDFDLLPTVTVMASEGDFHKVETQSQEAIRWTVAEPRITFEFSFVNMPMGSGFSGKGHFYLYLTDQDKNCVSNIVAWPVVFK